MTLRSAAGRRRSPLLAELLMAAPTASRLWIPAVLHPPGPWNQAIAGVALPGLMIGFLLLGWVRDPWQRGAVMLAVAVGTALAMARVFQRASHPVAQGCEVDFVERKLVQLGAAGVVEWPLDAHDHSVGFIVEPQQNGRIVANIELRHRRRGTLTALTTLTTPRQQAVRDMDALANVLAERLGVRRSGLPLA